MDDLVALADLLPEEVRRYFLKSAALNFAAQRFADDAGAASVAIILHRDGVVEVNTTDRLGLTTGETL